MPIFQIKMIFRGENLEPGTSEPTDIHSREGFAIYRAGMVRRLSSVHFLVKTKSGAGSFLIDLQDGEWVCDCGQPKFCEHAYAAKLEQASARTVEDPVQESRLRCRYCASPDVERAGFRYNAHGMARRYRCNECLRKFSISYSTSYVSQIPSDLIWLLSEIGASLAKLDGLTERIALELSHGRSEEQRK